MTLPQNINLGFLSFPTIYFVIALVVLVVIFFVWHEATKDGFDNEKVFDLLFSLLGLSFGGTIIFNYYAPYRLFLRGHKEEMLIVGFTLISILIIKIVSKVWKWSVYRLLDIFSLLLFSFFGYKYIQILLVDLNHVRLIALILYVIAYFTLFIRRSKMLSGLLFSLFLLMTSIVGQFFYSEKLYLIFYFLLITISMAVLVFRTKRNMTNNKISLDFIQKIKDFLKNKSKRLKSEQKKLIEDDPYLQEGRDSGNAEDIDEAILEDLAKTEIEIKKKNVLNMSKEVDNALDKIEEGKYGLCEICGSPIDKARLEAYPEAVTCLECSTKETQ